jgi:hypothetical protein
MSVAIEDDKLKAGIGNPLYTAYVIFQTMIGQLFPHFDGAPENHPSFAIQLPVQGFLQPYHSTITIYFAYEGLFD